MIPTHTEEAIRLGRTITPELVMVMLELRRVNLDLCRDQVKSRKVNEAFKSATRAQLCRETIESYLHERSN